MKSFASELGSVAILLLAACSADRQVDFSPESSSPIAGQRAGGAAGATSGTAAETAGGGVASSGRGGDVGMGGSSGATAGAPLVGESVLQRNGDARRSGHYVRAALTHATVKQFFFDVGFKSTFEGAVKSSPLYRENGPDGRAAVLLATLSNDVYALDAQNGATLWHRRVGTAPPAGSVPCAASEQFGSVGTPVIDPETRTLYVAAAVGTTTLERHEIHALSLDDGSERAGYPLDVAKLTSGFEAAQQHQWSALSLNDGTLLVAYGGAGTCQHHHGWLFAINTQNTADVGVWRSLSFGAGIDAFGGLASEGVSSFATTGPAGPGASARDDSQELVRFDQNARPGSTDRDQFFTPRWQTMNQRGASLGAVNPVLVDVAAGNPASYVASISSDGRLYLRDRQNLGGAGAELDLTSGTPAAIHTVPTVYQSARGSYIAFTAAGGVSCPGHAPPPGNTGQALVSVRIASGAVIQPQVAWCYYMINAAQGAPISTTTDGLADATVWFMDDQNRKLLGLDGDTGEVLFNGGHDVSNLPFEQRTCPGVADAVSPIPVGDRLMIAGNGRLCSWCRVSAPGGACL